MSRDGTTVLLEGVIRGDHTISTRSNYLGIINVRACIVVIPVVREREWVFRTGCFIQFHDVFEARVRLLLL